MTIEAGARAGLIAPDDITFAYLRNRPFAPRTAELWAKAESYWRGLCSDEGASFDTEIYIRGEKISPTVTWGTSPEDNVPVTGCVPDPMSVADPQRRAGIERALSYMDLTPGTRMEDISINKVFLGSCTNSRIEDLRSAVSIIRAVGSDARVAPAVLAMVVPGSGVVKKQAEEEGLDVVFKRAGFQWREPGCSMCCGLNADKLSPGERCASTSNRNFRGRQGPGGRTHLLSPAMAAAAALTGKLTDVRRLISHRQETIVPNPVAASVTDNPQILFGGNTDSDGLIQPKPADNEASNTSKPVEPETTAAYSVQFISVRGFAAPLHLENVDTDMIIPAHLLKGLVRTGLGFGLFYGLRYDMDSKEKTDFVLNRDPFTNAKILVCTGANFGCGSSREHAAWSLKDFGISCVIAPSFSDIFAGNCLQNGLLTVALKKELCDALAEDAAAGLQLEVDLSKEQIIRVGSGLPTIHFKTDAANRQRLLAGLDDIAITLTKWDTITLFEQRRQEMWPWLEVGQESARNDKRRVRIITEGSKLDW